MGTCVIVFHLVLVVHYSFGIYNYLFGLIIPPEVDAVRSSYGGPFKYLTFINMLLQCGYFIYALVNDLFGSDTREFRKASRLQRVRDFLFTTLVFSVGAFVTVSFWVLFNINRDLIFPKIFDSFFPNWLNHNIHTTPLFGVLLELWACPHQFPSSHKGFLVIASAMTIYILWLCYIAGRTGFWVYPILQKLPIIGRVAFIVGMAILTYIFSVIAKALDNKIWGSEPSKKKSLKKSQ